MKNIQFINHYIELAVELLREQLRHTENTLISPFSVEMLMAMLADATNGETQKEITDVICPGMDHNKLLTTLRALQRTIKESDSVTYANAVIMNENIAYGLNDNYKSTLKDNFNGNIFTSRDCVHDANTWVCEKTNGMITSVVDDKITDALFAVISAIAFNSEWREAYDVDDVFNENFYNADGSKSIVKMLFSTENEYLENESFQGFAKPYKGNEFSFVALLPKEETKKIDYNNISVNITEMYEQRRECIVKVQIPEFENTVDINLNDVCRRKGIKTVFSSVADFSPISSEWLKVDSVKHNAVIKVDRCGTKAAAVTRGLVVAGCCLDFKEVTKYVFLNRPFLYAIVHNKTGIPLFMGCVNKLKQLQDENVMTKDELEELCGNLMIDISDKIFGEDYGIDYPDDAPELKIYSSARKAAITGNFKELKKIRDQVLDGDIYGAIRDCNEA